MYCQCVQTLEKLSELKGVEPSSQMPAFIHFVAQMDTYRTPIAAKAAEKILDKGKGKAAPKRKAVSLF